MDLTVFWYSITLIGTPEYWAIAAVGLLAIYLILRRTIPENASWKKHQPGFKRFLWIFIPSLLIFLGLALVIKTLWFVQRPCMVCTENTVVGPLGTNAMITPPICNPYCLPDSSFPSGHAGTIFVVFSSLLLVYRKNPVLPAVFILAILISYSRIALGVHTGTDVVSGALLGLIIPFLASVMLRKYAKIRRI